MIDAEQETVLKNTMTGAAFVGWQMGAAGTPPKVSFEKYLQQLGLSEKPPALTPEQRHAIAEQSLATAEKINAAFRAGKLQ